jgi:hypothetical protein
MADEIKAIETNYMGCRFRSRLEARWAVFFDALGWNWEHEKEGYVIGYDKTIPWLPDFEITTPKGQHFYVEVKGDPNFFKDGIWLERLDWHGGPPGFPDSSWDYYSDKDNDPCLTTRKPIILLGDVPRVREGAEIWMPVIFHHEGVHGRYCLVCPDGLELVYDRRVNYTWDNLGPSGGIDNFGVAVGWAQSPESAAVVPAVHAALGARFEHGEKGANK